jgi:hypothetical protein
MSGFSHGELTAVTDSSTTVVLTDRFVLSPGVQPVTERDARDDAGPVGETAAVR